jgi:hypothetical protein
LEDADRDDDEDDEEEEEEAAAAAAAAVVLAGLSSGLNFRVMFRSEKTTPYTSFDCSDNESVEGDVGFSTPRLCT